MFISETLDDFYLAFDGYRAALRAALSLPYQPTPCPPQSLESLGYESVEDYLARGGIVQHVALGAHATHDHQLVMLRAYAKQAYE